MASHPKRLEHFPYTGKHRYFFTFCTQDRRCYFEDAAHVSLVTTQLLQSSTFHDVAVDTYCAMPDHVHLLVQGTTDTADARGFMAHFKQHTGWRFRQATRRRLWQGSYYDHVVREEEGVAGVISYIVNNPVRAGLVESPDDYPFWGSFTQTREGLLAFMKGAGEWKPPKTGQPIKG